jgi:SpoVK/Ycf46/Vps4 family AAA+-type ATPase
MCDKFKNNPNITKIKIDEHDHLYHSITFYGVTCIKSNNSNSNSIIYSSKFKNKDKKNELFKTLGEGIFELNYKDSDIYISINNVGNPVGLDNTSKIHSEVCIYIDKSKIELLEDFFEDASKFYVDNVLDKKKELNKTTIYVWDEYWETIEKRQGRKLSTIYLGGIENKIHDKIKHFLSTDTKQLYNDLGIPYKLNLLFHGYPGTGKSSLIFSLASELNMDVALLHFVKDMSDLDFMRALRKIPINTILVLEDIDVLFEERKKGDENKTGISFSGILNSLDGISHLEDQIIFMTTNCKMVLDKALTRPGRIDMDVEFKYSTKKQIKAMFEKFIPSQKEKFDEFYKNIKHLKLTTAILQQYLFGNIYCENILDTIDDLKNICSNNTYEFKKETLYT